MLISNKINKFSCWYFHQSLLLLKPTVLVMSLIFSLLLAKPAMLSLLVVVFVNRYYCLSLLCSILLVIIFVNRLNLLCSVG